MTLEQTAFDRFRDFLANDNGGERDTLTTLMLLALVVIPLLLCIIAFGDQILDYAKAKWDLVMGSGVGG